MMAVNKHETGTNSSTIKFKIQKKLLSEFENTLHDTAEERELADQLTTEFGMKLSINEKENMDQPKYNAKEIMTVIDQFASDANVISDGSRSYSLPTISGKHKDLNSISPTTLFDVLDRYYQVLGSLRIIDCRYPYEYIGGHIKGAENRYTESMIQDMVTECIKSQNDQSHILIFHCEFSSKRAPKLLRFLRNLDRKINSLSYPALYFPEIYLLDGGYKDFYNIGKCFCSPTEYIPMLSAAHSEDLRHIRCKNQPKKRLRI